MYIYLAPVFLATSFLNNCVAGCLYPNPFTEILSMHYTST